MKKVLFIFAMLLQMASANAQAMYGKPQFALPGGEEGKNYAVIVITDLNKKDLIDKAKAYLISLNLTNPDKSASEFDENSSDYIVHCLFRQPMSKCKGMMGMIYFADPLKLYGDIRFEFHDNGNVMVVVQNFSTEFFIYTADIEHWKKQTEETQEYLDEMRTGIVGTLEEVLKNRDKKFENYNKLVSEGKAEWMVGQQYVDYLNKQTFPGHQYQANGVKKFVDEGRLVGLPQDRWEKYVRPFYDVFFMQFCEHLNGTINQVAEDGEVTWDMFDGQLLPKDAKQQKKLKKEGKNYFTQYKGIIQ